MRNAWIVVMLMGACSAKGKDKFEDMIVEMDALATKLCACEPADAECMTKASAELLEFRKGLKDRVGDDKASRDQEKRGRALEEKLRECRTRSTGVGFDQVLTKLADYKTQACACTDKACADLVRDAWKAYRATMKDQLGSASTPSDEQDARGVVIDTEMKTCLDRFP